MSIRTKSGADITVVDGDAHVFEAEDIWERHVPAEYRAAARAALWHSVNEHGDTLRLLNGSPIRPLNRSKVIRQAIWRPGLSVDDIGRLDPDQFHELNAGAWDADARLSDMDALGIDHQVIYPTLFAEDLPFVENPDVAAVLARAYNDWIWELCQRAPDRLHPVAVLPLQSLMLAHAELDRIADRGFRGVFLRPMFYQGAVSEDRTAEGRLRQFRQQTQEGFLLSSAPGVFLEDRHFRPLWEHIDALGLVACVHPALGNTNPEGTCNGPFMERVSQRLLIGHSVTESAAYMQDMGVFLVAACYHGLLEDYPSLRLALAHAGASMLPLAIEKSETYLWLGFTFQVMSAFPWNVSLEPEEVFERHPLVVSFDGWERSVGRLAHDLFAEKANWGSRYPHHDTSTPAEALAMLEDHDLPDDTVRRLMGGNAAELFRLPVAAPVS